MKILKYYVCFLLSVFFILSGCQLEESDETVIVQNEKKVEPEPEPEPEMTDMDSPSEIDMNERKWTFMIYMTADNNLESSALEDLCEMESSKLNTDEVTVLILLDRNPAYDTSDGNWSGTRLYRLVTGRSGDAKGIISEPIECNELGLSLENDVEIDMSSDYVLSNFITFSRKKYPAENYGLIIWGHGSGWRSLPEELCKGFSYDETSKTYMTLHQMRIALKNGVGTQPLDFLGFDTCFGGEIEVMYELKDYAKYCVGSEGLIMSSGWNYERFFSNVEKEKDKSVEKILELIVEQFKKQYEYSYRASIAVVKMSEMNQLFKTFDDECKKVSKLITTAASRDKIMNLLYSSPSCQTQKYTYGTVGNDIYLDIRSVVEQLEEYQGNSYENSDFASAEKAAVINSWASDRQNGGLGVYFSTLVEGNLLSTTAPSAYIKGRTIDQLLFVCDSTGYVPCDPTGESLIDKLFFTSF